VETQGNDGVPFAAPGLSPLDPGWTPETGSTVSPAVPLAPPAPSVAPPAASPAGSETTLPAYPQDLPEPPAAAMVPAAEAPEAPLASGGPGAAPEAAPESAYVRAAIEEESDFEVGLLTELLIKVQDSGASDLHLSSGARPTIRIHGSLMALDERPIMTPPVIQRMMYAILTQKQREHFEEDLELDFAYAVPGRARFRVNLYRQRDSLGAAFRIIPYEIKALEELGIPPAVSNFAMLPRGFVLVTGPTGSGKSTTLASLVDLANRQRRDHIMTVEDPIEFLHKHKSCLVNQREVGEDTWSFQNALKHVLRQDPDIILVGEMRDLETISVALTAAETGHLVFATLHTQDAAQTIDRVIDVFPPHQQQQIRVQLAGALQGVVCQTLCKTFDGKGRAVATEVLVATPAIRNLIREGKTHQIYSSLQAGAKHGMHTLDQHLAELVKSGRITYETALEKCHHVEDFNRLTGRG
jgi:twitching motility protein PilT